MCACMCVRARAHLCSALGARVCMATGGGGRSKCQDGEGVCGECTLRGKALGGGTLRVGPGDSAQLAGPRARVGGRQLAGISVPKGCLSGHCHQGAEKTRARGASEPPEAHTWWGQGSQEPCLARGTRQPRGRLRLGVFLRAPALQPCSSLPFPSSP